MSAEHSPCQSAQPRPCDLSAVTSPLFSHRNQRSGACSVRAAGGIGSVGGLALAPGAVEGRIAELENKLSNSQIIDPLLLNADGACVFGATIDLEDVISGTVFTYQIVGDDEADIKQGKISISSPVSRALIGKKSGDVAEVVAPKGLMEYVILDVRYI